MKNKQFWTTNDGPEGFRYNKSWYIIIYNIMYFLLEIGLSFACLRSPFLLATFPLNGIPLDACVYEIVMKS